MRYQEPIYSQNENSGVRNKDILNVNMSSDICIFDSPLFIMSGTSGISASKINCTGSSGISASKINCTGSTTQYIISTATTIPLTFNFTANTSSFTANSATFKFEIYKYDSSVSGFTLPPVYKSDPIEYPTFSATNYTLQTILVSNLNLDGDYLIKGYYEYPICTEFLNKLGKTVDTLTYRSGKTNIFKEFKQYSSCKSIIPTSITTTRRINHHNNKYVCWIFHINTKWVGISTKFGLYIHRKHRNTKCSNCNWRCFDCDLYN